MANGTATVTGKTGANQTLTASVFSNVTGFNLLFGDNVLAITYGTPSKTAYISLDEVLSSINLCK